MQGIARKGGAAAPDAFALCNEAVGGEPAVACTQDDKGPHVRRSALRIEANALGHSSMAGFELIPYGSLCVTTEACLWP